MTASGVVLFGLVLAGCVLLWPAGRRLGLTPLGIAIAVGAAALVALPVAAAGAAGPAGPALLCVVLGVLIAGSDPGSKVAAGGLALAAVLNAPVVAVALLVGLTLLLASPGSGPEMSRPWRAGLYVAGIGGALLVAVPTTGARSWALATPTGGVGATIAAALVLACAVALTGLVWMRLPWLRPVAAAAAAQAACALVPGTSVAVLVLVAPLLGVVAAVALTEIVLPGRSRYVGAGVVGAVLVGSAAALLGSGPAADDPALTTTAVSSAVPEGAVPEGAVPSGVRPVRLRIPALAVDSPLVDLATDGAGALTPPASPDVAGWFAAGTVPGDTGPAVIGGHVDSNAGPGVFFSLERLRAGDTVEVDRSDGTSTAFVVRAVDRFPKDRFPTDRVYGPAPAPELRLVTCGGSFDRAVQSYRDNVVVEAVRA